MVNLIIKMLYDSKETFKITNRASAEKMAEEFYECEDVYAYEILSNETGELLVYKSKGI